MVSRYNYTPDAWLTSRPFTQDIGLVPMACRSLVQNLERGTGGVLGRMVPQYQN